MSTLRFRTDEPSRQLVGAAACGFCGIVHIRRLLDMGSVPRCAFPFWAVSLSFLFTGIVRPRARRLVWSSAAVDSRVGDWSHAYPLGAGRISRHLLLLSRRVLQSFLGGPAFLHRR